MTSDVLASVERHASAVSAAAVDKARRLCAEHPHVAVETLVESGDPRDVICDAADKVGADLLVMGSHGYGFIQRYQSSKLQYITRSTSIGESDAMATGWIRIGGGKIFCLPSHPILTFTGRSWAVSATTARRTANARSSSSRGPRSRPVLANAASCQPVASYM